MGVNVPRLYQPCPTQKLPHPNRHSRESGNPHPTPKTRHSSEGRNPEILPANVAAIPETSRIPPKTPYGRSKNSRTCAINGSVS